MPRELLFSIDRRSFVFQEFRAGGKGGQKQNKTSTGIRCLHPPSGARAESRVHRDQLHNKRQAWRKCVESTTFQTWLRKQIAYAEMTKAKRRETERRYAITDSNLLNGLTPKRPDGTVNP